MATWGPIVMVLLFAVAPTLFLAIWALYALWCERRQKQETDQPLGDQAHYDRSIYYAKRREK